MVDYYVDLDNNVAADATGLDNTGNEYAGPAGLQAAIRGTGNATALAAGDELFMKGTGDLGRLVLFDCAGADVSAWAPLDVVRNKDGAGDDWTGVVVEANDDPPGAMGADDLLLVWMDTGKSAVDVDILDGIENVTAVAFVDPITSATTPGILDDTAAGGTPGIGPPIIFNGVNPLWTEDGTKCVWDGAGKAAYCLSCLGFDYHWWKNQELKSAVTYNLTGNATANRHMFLNCDFHTSGGKGKHVSPNTSVFVLCRFYNNATGGAHMGTTDVMVLCSAYGNGSDGFYATGNVPITLISCLSYDNGLAGYSFDSLPGSLLFSVGDCNGEDGFWHDRHGLALGCRFTNNVEHGLESVDAHIFDLYNAMLRNIGGAVTGDTINQTVKGVSTRITTGDVGYEDVIYTFDFDGGVGVAFTAGETITGDASGTTAVILTVTDVGATGTITFRNQTGSMFLDGETITGGAGGKTADVDGRVNVSGTPRYNLAFGAAGYRSEADMGGGNFARFARGLPAVPVIKVRG